MVGIATITPTVLVALLASTYYYLGIESFFNEQVSNAIAHTSDIAQLYIDEHKENVKLDALSVANSIEHSYILREKPELLPNFLDRQSQSRGLAEIMLFTKDRIIAHNSLGLALVFERIPIDILYKADDDIIILRDGFDNRVRAIAKLHSFRENTYILVGRYTDQEIIQYLQETKGSVANYEILLGNIQLTRNKLTVAFIILSGALCFIVVLIAIKLANLISRPLEQLAEATSSIKAGDFSVRIPESKYKDEITVLSKAFNAMTERIAHQRSELIQVNELIDSRRRFIEAVLSELSAGVLAINAEGIIVLCNTSASNLLAFHFNNNNNIHFSSIFPELEDLVQKVAVSSNEEIYDHIIIKREEKDIHLLVKLGIVYDSQDTIENIIITFNDITELVSAQRLAAWADIARRIAHEIKNPLTPIQLAAERIKSKYIAQSQEENEQVSRYIDTIIKHVKDIEQMVVEFVEFARLPAPRMQSYKLRNIIEESVLLQKAAYPSIKYNIQAQDKHCYVLCDRSQISRIFNNLLKNAAESICSNDDNAIVGTITITINIDQKNNVAVIAIADTGKGIDSTIMNRITEPYVTTKKKGTGLGLSIVQKIIEDHKSKLVIENIQDSGAIISFSLNLADQDK